MRDQHDGNTGCDNTDQDRPALRPRDQPGDLRRARGGVRLALLGFGGPARLAPRAQDARMFGLPLGLGGGFCALSLFLGTSFDVDLAALFLGLRFARCRQRGLPRHFGRRRLPLALFLGRFLGGGRALDADLQQGRHRIGQRHELVAGLLRLFAFAPQRPEIGLLQLGERGKNVGVVRFGEARIDIADRKDAPLPFQFGESGVDRRLALQELGDFQAAPFAFP